MARPRSLAVPGARPAPVGRPHAVRHLVARGLTGYAESVTEDPMRRYPGALLGCGFVSGPVLGALPLSWALSVGALAATPLVTAEAVEAIRSGSHDRLPWAGGFLAVPAAWAVYLGTFGMSDPWPLVGYAVPSAALLAGWSLRGTRRRSGGGGDLTKQFRRALAIPAGGRMVRTERADGRGFTLTLDLGPGDDSNALTPDWLTSNFAPEKVARALRMKGADDAQRVLLRPLAGYGEVVIDVMDTNPWTEPILHPVLSGQPPERTSASPWRLGVDPASDSAVEVPVFGANGAGSHMLLVGRSGSGKSCLLDGLLEHLTACRDVDVWLADAGKLVITRTWAAAVERVALSTGREGLQELAAMLDELDAERLRRAALDPAQKAELPRIAFVLDEAPQALGEEAEKQEDRKDLVRYVRSRVVSLIQTARSEGISLIIASQRGTKTALGTTDIPTNIMTKIMMAVGDAKEQSMILGASWRAEGVPALFGLDVAKGRAWVQSEQGRTQARAYYLPEVDVPALVASRALVERPEVVRPAVRETLPPWPGEGGPGWPASLESTPEAHLWAAFLRSRDGELREVVAQYRESASGRPRRFDFYLPGAKLAVEVDGKDFHSAVDDAERDAAHAEVGIRTLRFPASEVMKDASGCVAKVLAAVRGGEPAPRIAPGPDNGRAVEAYGLLCREFGPGEAIPTGRAREVLRPGDEGRTEYSKLIKEMVGAGLLVRRVDMATKRPYSGKATSFELTRVDALLPV